MVAVINTMHRSHEKLTADVRLYDFNMNIVWQQQQPLSIGEDCYKELFTLPQPKEITPVYYARLLLKDGNGKVVSENFYWLSADGKNDFRAITQMPKVDLQLTSTTTTKDNDIVMRIKVKNSTNRLAFMHRLMITKGDSEDEVLPTFWTDNFLTIFPGEEREVMATFTRQDLEGATPVLKLDRNQ